ncbi:MAG: ribosomal protein [Actinomycetia bacterium]|nr:ribosomal protein [Actinomycetes bacterium]
MPTKASEDSEQIQRKSAVINEITTRLLDSDAAVLTEYRGLSVTDLANLRAALRPAATDYKVFKNTLARRAVSDAGMTEVAALLEGPVAIAFVRREGGDPVIAAKALRDFARINPNLVLKGGLLGPRVLTGRDVENLADVPPREVLLARLAGGFQAPLVKAAGLFQAFTRNFAYGLKAYIDQRAPEEGSPAPAIDQAADAAGEPDQEHAPEEGSPAPATDQEHEQPAVAVDSTAPAAAEAEAPAPEAEPEAAAEAANTAEAAE